MLVLYIVDVCGADLVIKDILAVLAVDFRGLADMLGQLQMSLKEIGGLEEELTGVTSQPGVHVIKLFPSSLMTRPNKLECL
jgi:hypothetical protein